MRSASDIVLELAATIAYFVEGGCNMKKAIEETKTRKPLKATPERIKTALSLLDDLGLSPTPKKGGAGSGMTTARGGPRPDIWRTYDDSAFQPRAVVDRSMAAMRRAVSVKCWTSSGVSARSRMRRSR